MPTTSDVAKETFNPAAWQCVPADVSRNYGNMVCKLNLLSRRGAFHAFSKIDVLPHRPVPWNSARPWSPSHPWPCSCMPWCGSPCSAQEVNPNNLSCFFSFPGATLAQGSSVARTTFSPRLPGPHFRLLWWLDPLHEKTTRRELVINLVWISLSLHCWIVNMLTDMPLWKMRTWISFPCVLLAITTKQKVLG